MVDGENMPLHAMLQKDIHNQVPEAVLKHCAEDRVLVENLLHLAQTELLVLNLASTTIVHEQQKLVIHCCLTGPAPSVCLTSMRALQAYSPARVGEARIVFRRGSTRRTRRRPPPRKASRRGRTRVWVLTVVRSFPSRRPPRRTTMTIQTRWRMMKHLPPRKKTGGGPREALRIRSRQGS